MNRGPECSAPCRASRERGSGMEPWRSGLYEYYLPSFLPFEIQEQSLPFNGTYGGTHFFSFTKDR